eukprot:EG_transcript_17005
MADVVVEPGAVSTASGSRNVLKKISCIFDCTIEEVPSKKRAGQAFSVVVQEALSAEGLAVLQAGGIATEKVDGTCCLVQSGRLWKRHDLKPNSVGAGKYKKYQEQLSDWKRNQDGPKPRMNWDPAADWKDPPEGWVAADDPEDAGHWIGWLACAPEKPEDKWHIAALTPDLACARLVVQRSDGFQVDVVPLQELEGVTLELIGPKVQGNLYGLPSAPPRHCLVRHGGLRFARPPPITLPELRQWFEEDPEGAVEGIVWHSEAGMVKLHRHHLNLPWPLKARATRLQISLLVDASPV